MPFLHDNIGCVIMLLYIMNKANYVRRFSLGREVSTKDC